jgi:hypothetical protein
MNSAYAMEKCSKQIILRLLPLVLIAVCAVVFLRADEKIPPESSREAGVVGLTPKRFAGKVVLDIAAAPEAFRRQRSANLDALERSGFRLRPLFSRSTEELERDRTAASAEVRMEPPDLTRWFSFEAPAGVTMEAALQRLRSLPYVDVAYALPRAVPASLGADEVPDFTPLQSYLESAPGGLDVLYAWRQPGGMSERVAIADVEGDWNVGHHDLRRAKEKRIDGELLGGIWYQHGTAVLGQLVGTRNGKGVTGIANKSKVLMFSIGRRGANGKLDTNVPDAVNRAAAALEPGDVMVLEVQYSGLRQSGNYIPVEYFDADFEAILAASHKGIVVVEAAGNGNQNLDAPLYEERFDRQVRDSLAIMVGAGAPPGDYRADRARLYFSNYGSRVDVQGWGSSVTTTGYGDLYSKGGRNFYYTAGFNGTSSATGMVAGAVAVLQSIAVENDGNPLKPRRLRRILARTGSPQEGDKKQHIGSRPNLRKAVRRIYKIK